MWRCLRFHGGFGSFWPVQVSVPRSPGKISREHQQDFCCNTITHSVAAPGQLRWPGEPSELLLGFVVGAQNGVDPALVALALAL